jgi:hypothetical protein
LLGKRPTMRSRLLIALRLRAPRVLTTAIDLEEGTASLERANQVGRESSFDVAQGSKET